MLLLIEIILTFFAWRNGWKWLALIPVGVALFIGFFIGFGVGLSGGSTDGLNGLVIVDILAVIALIIMLLKKGKYRDE